MTGTLGSIHAFSVLLIGLETRYESSRAEISLIYSLALVFLTLAVLLGHRIYPRLKPPWLVLLACSGAASGLWLSIHSSNWWVLCFGYSFLFGTANGLGYGYVLQLVARAMPDWKGFAMGTVTAVYAVGATVFAKVLAEMVATYSLGVALEMMAVILVGAGILAAVILKLSEVRYDIDAAHIEAAPMSSLLVLRLWVAYGAGVAAGLMAIGHASAIAKAAGAAESTAVLGAMIVGVGNAMGGFMSGAAVDRLPAKVLLVVLPILSAASLTTLALIERVDAAIAALGVVGFCYGAIIAIYPYAVNVLFGSNWSAQAYGRVFTAWGVAGLGAPWFAGFFYDTQGNYVLALLIAAAIALLSTLVAASLPRVTSAAPE